MEKEWSRTVRIAFFSGSPTEPQFAVVFGDSPQGIRRAIKELFAQKIKEL